MSHTTGKPFFGVSDQIRHKPVCSALDTRRSIYLEDAISVVNNKGAYQTVQMHKCTSLVHTGIK